MANKSVKLIIGLNPVTSPNEVKRVHGLPGISVRYLNEHFHAKVYIFDDEALLGSANLTDGGLKANREAVICLDHAADKDTVRELKALFNEWWDAARVLTDETVEAFSRAYVEAQARRLEADAMIAEAVGEAPAPNIDAASTAMSTQRVFIENLRRDVYERYRPAFQEVVHTLSEGNLHRRDLLPLGVAHETNRFLNYVRVRHARGDESWQNAPLRMQQDRKALITGLGREWVGAEDNRVPEHFVSWLATVRDTFGEPQALLSASKARLTEGLMSIHAFFEQYRFVKGGEHKLSEEFWTRNQHNTERVRGTLVHLLYGEGDFAERLHDTLYSQRRKLENFGYFCSLELYGTIHPEQFPPINGRIAKALRFLGFDVDGS